MNVVLSEKEMRCLLRKKRQALDDAVKSQKRDLNAYVKNEKSADTQRGQTGSNHKRVPRSTTEAVHQARKTTIQLDDGKKRGEEITLRIDMARVAKCEPPREKIRRKGLKRELEL